MLKMWSHLLLFSKFLQANSSPFNRDPHDIVWERKISLYRFRNRFAVLTNTNQLGLKETSV